MLDGQWERRHGQLSLLPLRVSSGVLSLIRRQGNFRQRLSQHEPANDSIALLYLNPLCLASPIPMNLMRPGALGYALICIFLWPSKVAAAIVNATIDDQVGDSVTHRLVNYYPNQAFWDDQMCISNCIILDKSQAFDNTYTAGTYNPPPDDGSAAGVVVGETAEQFGSSRSLPPTPRDLTTAVSIGISMQFTGRNLTIFLF